VVERILGFILETMVEGEKPQIHTAERCVGSVLAGSPF
jgi:hypothetical protein